MGEPFSKAVVKELPFYFVAYPAPGGAAGRGDAPAARRTGRRWPRRRSSSLPADAQGRIAQVSRIPVEALPPGTYELRVSVKQGLDDGYPRTLMFRLVP